MFDRPTSLFNLHILSPQDSLYHQRHAHILVTKKLSFVDRYLLVALDLLLISALLKLRGLGMLRDPTWRRERCLVNQSNFIYSHSNTIKPLVSLYLLFQLPLQLFPQPLVLLPLYLLLSSHPIDAIPAR